MIGKFKTVHLIGSTKGNAELFSNAEKYFTKKGIKGISYSVFDMLKDKEWFSIGSRSYDGNIKKYLEEL